METSRVYRLLSVLLLGQTIACTKEPPVEKPPAKVAEAQPTPNATAEPGLHQLTDSPDMESFPSFSPDGTHLAYASDRSGSLEIYIRRLDRPDGELQITADGQQNLQPAFSPDGKLLAYTSHGRGGLCIISADGGQTRQLTDFGSAPAWSPDGDSLIFQSDSFRELSLFAYPALPPSTLWFVPVAGGEPRQLTRPGEPAGGHGAPTIAPDGRRVAFTSFTIWSGELWTMAMDGSDLERVEHAHYPRDPVYSSDGESLYYGGPDRVLGYNIWRIPASGGGKPAALSPVPARSLAITSDGRRLAFGHLNLDSWLWSIPISESGDATGPAIRLTEDGQEHLSSPAYSPDGQRIAAYRRPATNRHEVWLLNADGSEPTQLSDAGTFASGRPSWTSDGSHLRFLSRPEGPAAVWMEIDLETLETVPLQQLERDWAWGRLSSDGRRVAFHRSEKSGGANVWVVSEPGAEPTQLTSDAEFTGFPIWSRDDSLLAVNIRRGADSHIGVVPAAGGPLTQLTFEPGKRSQPMWSPDRTRIVFAAQRGGFWNLWWVPRAGGQERQLTDLPRKFNVYLRYPDWSPQGDQIVFEFGEVRGDLWILDL